MRARTPAAALSLLLAACSGHGASGQGGSAPSSGATATPTTTAGQGGGAGCPDVPAQILAPRCGTAGCHDDSGKPAQGLDLASPGFEDAIVDAPGAACSGLLVSTKHPELSLLYDKLLASPSCGARMPLGQPALSDSEIACVKSWIVARGAGGSGAGGASAGTGAFGGFGGGEPGMGTCTDGIRNGVETDVDCGGICPLCGVGKGCSGPSDCVSFACAAGVCIDASCADGVQNGAETDLDCGGAGCPGCPGGANCQIDADCASALCQPNAVCASSCSDGWQDGLEKGVDCGGLCPTGCPAGTACDVATDCASQICASGACAAPACTDLIANGGESDVDCGGPCAPCPLGKHCQTNADCAAGGCVGGTCRDVLYISELRTHGKDGNGFSDEFIELYNPGSAPVVLTSAWTVWARNAIGGCQGMGYGGLVFSGAGQSIPPHGHLLLAGAAYAQAPAKDAAILNSGGFGALGDAGSVTVLYNGSLVDSICYYMDASTEDALLTCSKPYPCMGSPVSNGQPLAGMDASLERRPGGALGSGQMTGDNAADFALIAPARPESLASPPVP